MTGPNNFVVGGLRLRETHTCHASSASARRPIPHSSAATAARMSALLGARRATPSMSRSAPASSPSCARIKAAFAEA